MNQLLNIEDLSVLPSSFLATQQDLLTPDIIPGMAVGMGIFISVLALRTAFKLTWKKKENNTEWGLMILKPNPRRPLNNYHTHEKPKDFSSNKNYILMFISSENEERLVPVLYMPSDLIQLRNTIERVHRQALDSREVIDVMFRRLEARERANPRLDHRFLVHTDDYVNYIPFPEAAQEKYDIHGKNLALLRKLESAYLLYNPSYTRKPLFLGEI